MVIHCLHCGKLFYFENFPEDAECQVCGSPDAHQLPSTIIFETAPIDSKGNCAPDVHNTFLRS